MSALTQPRQPILETLKNEALPIAAVQVWQGARIYLDTTNNVATIGNATSTTLIPVGIAAESVNNSGGTSGGIYCLVELDREVACQWLDNATGGAAVTALYANAYVLDDHSVQATGNSSAGRVWKLDPQKGVLVQSPAV